MVRVTIGLSAESTKSNLTSHWLALPQFFLQLLTRQLVHWGLLVRFERGIVVDTMTTVAKLRRKIQA